MKTLAISALLAFLLSVVWLHALAQVDSSAGSKPIIYTVVEQHPEFTGGMNKLGKYLRQNLRYPEAARKARIEGRVFVSFLVTDAGAIEDVKLVRPVSPELDAEAIRLIQEMPRWQPGRQDGKPVYCRYNLPVNFSL